MNLQCSRSRKVLMTALSGVVLTSAFVHQARPAVFFRVHCASTSLHALPGVRTAPSKHDLATGRDPSRVKVFDTTLRDGEQSPGCTMTADEKLVVARQLHKLGVDVIEAGFPFASPGDFLAVQRIANEVGNSENPPIICGLARATKNDIKACAEAISGAKFPRIHTFIATSDIHMEFKLKKSREEVLKITREMVSYARSLCEDVEFSAEDALRSDPEFLYQVYTVAIEAGATTLNGANKCLAPHRRLVIIELLSQPFPLPDSAGYGGLHNPARVHAADRGPARKR